MQQSKIIHSETASDIKFSAGIIVVWLAAFMPMEAGPIWIPTAQIHFGVDSVTMSMVASMQFLVSASMAILVAPRLARYSLHSVLLCSTATICIAALLTAACNLPFAVFVAVRMVEGGASGICVAWAAILASRTKLPARSFGLLQFSQILMNMAVYVSSTKLVVTYGLTGLYALIGGSTMVFFVVLALSKPWDRFVIESKMQSTTKRLPRVRIIFACIGAAFVYCGFIALVANASALGRRAGLDFEHVTILLAACTMAAAAGALTSTISARLLPPFGFIIAATLGSSIFGVSLTFFAFNFQTLVASLCGVIFFLYIGFPSIFGGIARLDEGGGSAAVAQAAQMFGPALGPAIGAIIAVHSVAAFAFTSAMFIAFGTLTAGLAVRPTPPRSMSVSGWSTAKSKV
jgi:hypothetical protein